MKRGKFELRKIERRDEVHDFETYAYYWRLKAGNGEILCHSETYESKQAALKGIASCRRVALLAKGPGGSE